MALMTAKEYIDSLRKLKTRVYMFGAKIDNWVNHPMIRPGINCVVMTYAMEIRRSAVDLICKECGAKLRLPTATDRDLDDLCCLTIPGVGKERLK